MAQQKLFQYALVYHPKPEKDANGNVASQKSVLLSDFTRILVDGIKEATVIASRAIPVEYTDKIDRIEFVINQLSM